MKINCCDVCYLDDGKDKIIGNNEDAGFNGHKITKAGWKQVFKRGSERMTFDLCAEHRETFKGKSYQEVNDIYNNIYYGKVTADALAKDKEHINAVSLRNKCKTVFEAAGGRPDN